MKLLPHAAMHGRMAPQFDWERFTPRRNPEFLGGRTLSSAFAARCIRDRALGSALIHRLDPVLPHMGIWRGKFTPRFSTTKSYGESGAQAACPGCECHAQRLQIARKVLTGLLPTASTDFSRPIGMGDDVIDVDADESRARTEFSTRLYFLRQQVAKENRKAIRIAVPRGFHLRPRARPITSARSQ